MANMRARIELRGCTTHTCRGRKVKRGEPFWTTNVSDIAYYQAQSEFSVSILEAPKPKPKPKSKPKAPAPPPPSSDEEESGDGDEDEDDDLEDAAEEPEESEEPEEPEVTSSYTKIDLQKLTKKALVGLANDDFNLELDPDISKSKMVRGILKAQTATLGDDD